jgi:hypothetical protein
VQTANASSSQVSLFGELQTSSLTRSRRFAMFNHFDRFCECKPLAVTNAATRSDRRFQVDALGAWLFDRTVRLVADHPADSVETPTAR